MEYAERELNYTLFLKSDKTMPVKFMTQVS